MRWLPRATDNYSFSFRASELRSTNSGNVYLGVQVQAAAGSNLQPAVPQIAGLTPVFTSTGTGSAFALFDITQAGLELLSISGANAATSGGYTAAAFRGRRRQRRRHGGRHRRPAAGGGHGQLRRPAELRGRAPTSPRAAP